ncbi:hypothetical protein [Neptunomonas phycophila]|uniref:hypothetical protein n=1 Tax=Neptunomonas phycophila TaxID=1572645 RepID=UPI00351526FD
MFNLLLEPIYPHLTAFGLALDFGGILIVLIVNFLPRYAVKIDNWLSDISYVSFTGRLEKPFFITYDSFYKYLFLPSFIYFAVASIYDFEFAKSMITDKKDFIFVIILFVAYFMGYMMAALLLIWWVIPLLYVFSSKVIYKDKPLEGCGFMLVVLGCAITMPQLMMAKP